MGPERLWLTASRAGYLGMYAVCFLIRQEPDGMSGPWRTDDTRGGRNRYGTALRYTAVVR
jgi:hypothetical protein